MKRNKILSENDDIRALPTRCVRHFHKVCNVYIFNFIEKMYGL